MPLLLCELHASGIQLSYQRRFSNYSNWIKRVITWLGEFDILSSNFIMCFYHPQSIWYVCLSFNGKIRKWEKRKRNKESGQHLLQLKYENRSFFQIIYMVFNKEMLRKRKRRMCPLCFLFVHPEYFLGIILKWCKAFHFCLWVHSLLWMNAASVWLCLFFPSPDNRQKWEAIRKTKTTTVTSVVKPAIKRLDLLSLKVDVQLAFLCALLSLQVLLEIIKLVNFTWWFS